MTGEPTYLAAIMVAGRVKDHFEKHLDAARERGERQLVPAPSENAIKAIIDTAFWASLRREEGYSPKISLAYISPDQAGQPLLFKQRLPLAPHVLTKISPGVERAGIHLGVWSENENLYIWGTTRSIPDLCFVLDVSEPGLLVVKHRLHQGFGKYTNVAVLSGDQVKMIDETSSKLPDCPSLLTSLLGANTKPTADTSNVLVQLAVSMRRHKHGGTLLVVPAESDTWQVSVLHPIKYSLKPAFTGLADLIRQEREEQNEILWKGALNQEIDYVAGLTAIDGATLMNDKYELLAFGIKITRKSGNPSVEQIMVTEPVVGGLPVVVHPSQSGGTRHFSAAQFVHDQRDALALVASQDGKFTIFSWSPCEGMVQAHQVDTLLL